jgi:hypothetical protein
VAHDAEVHRNPTLITMIDLGKYELYKSDSLAAAVAIGSRLSAWDVVCACIHVHTGA